MFFGYKNIQKMINHNSTHSIDVISIDSQESIQMNEIIEILDDENENDFIVEIPDEYE